MNITNVFEALQIIDGEKFTESLIKGKYNMKDKLCPGYLSTSKVYLLSNSFMGVMSFSLSLHRLVQSPSLMPNIEVTITLKD
jgi:hypothetical protein